MSQVFTQIVAEVCKKNTAQSAHVQVTQILLEVMWEVSGVASAPPEIVQGHIVGDPVR